MSTITKYLLADFVGGTATVIDSVDSAAFFINSDRGEGISHDNSEKIFHVDGEFMASAVRRIYEGEDNLTPPMSIEVERLQGDPPYNFERPSFSVIIGLPAPPAPSTNKTFAQIIW